MRTPNRTIVELKYDMYIIAYIALKSPNRTIVELKFNIFSITIDIVVS